MCFLLWDGCREIQESADENVATLSDERARHGKTLPLRGCSNNGEHLSCLRVHTSLPAELHAEDWVRQHPSEAAEESAQCPEIPAGEDDSDTDLTYGEVEQRLDQLQQHLNRCAGIERM